MKKKLLLIMAMSLGLSIFLCGCKEDLPSLEDVITEKVGAYKTDILDSSSTIDSLSKAESYLVHWAKTKGIKHHVDESGNVIMEVSPSAGYENAPKTVVLVPYDGLNFAAGADSMASALYLAKNTSYGPLTIIFTGENDHNFSAIEGIDKKYFEDSPNVFMLGNGSRALIGTASGAASFYQYSTPVTTKETSGDVAIQISISGLPGGYIDSKISSYLNPVKELSSLLASFKQNVYIYDLASFSGGTKTEVGSNLYPQFAQITIVVSKDDLTKFENRLTSEKEDFLYKYAKDYPDAKYEFTHVEVPTTVLRDESKNKIVSLSYTLLSGTYSLNEDEQMVALNSLTYAGLSEDAFEIDSLAYSTSVDILNEIDTMAANIAALSDVSFKKTMSIPSWVGSSDSSFAKNFATSYKTFVKKDLEYADNIAPTYGYYIHQLSSKSKMLTLKYNENHLLDYTGAIVTYLESLGTPASS